LATYLGTARAVAFSELRPLLGLAAARSPMEALKLLVAGAPDEAENLPVQLTAVIAVGLCAATQMAAGADPVAPDPALGHAADLLRMLRGTPATPAEVAALET
jgi:citrate synthase